MLKKSKKVFAGLLCLIMMMTLIPGNFVFGEEAAPENDYLGVARKSQYVLYASSKENGIQLNGKKYVINGNVHSNSDVAAYLDKLDVRGKLETTGKVINYNNGVTQYIKKENAPERVLIDPSKYIVDSLGANAKVYENWTSLSDSTLENTEPIQAKSGLQFSASVIKLKSTIMSNGNMLVNASETFVSPENEEVLLYSANGDIQVSAQDVEINGIIYAPNGTVQIGGTNVKINGMIIAKKIQIGANNKLIINQNLNLKNAEAFKYYNDELQIYSEAEYDDTTETINVNWESTFDEGKYEVYSSTDNKNFTLLGTVTGANTYAYKTNGSTNDIYFKVKQILNNGFTKESNTVKMVYDVYICCYVFEDTDTDNEKLTDTYEFFLETDKNNVDTDGDDLTDYAEVFLTGTDPLYKDSDEDGILDCDEDADGDTLINKYEIKIGSNPQKVDTDDDTLADNYEVAGIKIKGDDINTYKTLPGNADTDGDTLSDGDEALLGLNPLSKDSDGDGILDCNEMFKQKVEPLEIENPNSAVKEVNLDINIAGNAEKNVEMESVMGKDTYSSAVVGLIGEPIRIEAKSKFDTATLTFKIDKTKLGNTNFNDIQMMWYNEDTGFYEYFDTIHNEANSTVSTKTNHFCTILLVDGKVFENSFKEDLYSGHEDTDSVRYNFNTLISIDTSFNMSDDDPYEPIYPDNLPIGSGYKIWKHKCRRQEIVDNYLKELNNMSATERQKYKVAIAPFHFDLDTTYKIGDEDIVSEFKSEYPYNSMLDTYFRSDIIENEWGTEYNRAITQMISFLKQNDTSHRSGNIEYKTISSILFISDGAGEIDENFLRQVNAQGITINTVGVTENQQDLAKLKKMAELTGGKCYTAVDPDSLTTGYHDTDNSYINFTKNSDDDSIPDIFEQVGMKCSNGQTIYSDYESGDTDKDGLKDSEEIEMIMTPESYLTSGIPEYAYKNMGYKYCFTKHSDPNEVDTDWDGYSDYDEVNNYLSNPNQYNKIIISDTLETLLDDSYFSGAGIKDLQENDPVYKLCIFLGNNVYGNNYQKSLIYENALIDLIINEESGLNESFELIELRDTCNEYLGRLEESLTMLSKKLGNNNTMLRQEISNFKADIDSCKITSYNNVDWKNKDEYYNAMTRLSERASRLEQQSAEFKLIQQTNTVKMNFLDNTGKVLNTFSKAVTVSQMKDIVNKGLLEYIKIKSKQDTIYYYYDMLCLIYNKTYDSDLKKAAETVAAIVEEKIGAFEFETKKIIKELGNLAIDEISSSLISKLGPLGFGINFGRSIGNFLTNLSEVCKESVNVYIYSCIGEIISKEINANYSFNKAYTNLGKEYLSITNKDNKTLIKNYYYLLNVRISTEKSCKALYTAAPTYICKLVGLNKNDNIRSCEVGIYDLKKGYFLIA